MMSKKNKIPFNMSPLLITAFVMFLMLVAFETKADDEVVGHTEHGIAVTKNDIEIKSVRVDTIRSWEWIEETDTLRLTLNRNRKVDVEFFNRCFDMPFAGGLQFKPWGGFNSIGKGDSIMPISWSNRTAMWPCTIKRITEVIEKEND
jgi:hypothetical protein